MNPLILFRNHQEYKEEIESAKKIFTVKYLVTDLIDFTETIKGIVIARMCALPFYNEMYLNIQNLGYQMINSYQEHLWISNFEWYSQLEKYTFRSWVNPIRIPDNIKLVVKGRTNSKKWKWDTHMFAENKQQAIQIAYELSNDSMIGEQGIVYREYEELELIELGINGLRFVNEHRLFYYKDKLIANGYYWSIIDTAYPELDYEGYKFAEEIASICKNFTNFYSIDIAKSVTGQWRLVEVNDGQMSGLSTIDPLEFYTNLKKIVYE
jgi:hypothetical protein